MTEGTVIPDNSIAAGSPAKVLKTKDNRIANKLNASIYHQNALAYAKGDHRAWADAGSGEYIQAEIKRFQAEINSEN